jgi:signal transduction histidine kinase
VRIRALQTLRRRVAFATAALVLLVGLALIMTSLYSVARLRATRMSAFVRLLAKDPNAFACARDPRHFGMEMADGSSVYAYDRRTGASANPSSPPIDEALLRDIQRGEQVSIRSNILVGRGTIVIAVDQPAPCDTFQLHWRATSELRLRTTLSFAVILALGIAASVAGGALWVVRPLLKRLSHASSLAARVGRADAVMESAPTGSRAVVQDELTEVETALREAHARILDDRAQIESKNRALAEHLADVAHDLKTPLSSLQLQLEALSSVSSGDDEIAQTAARALADVVYLDSLVANLRVASELEEQARRVVSGELGSLLERCISRVTPLARRKGIELACARPDEPVAVLADVLHIERALMNLLQNAVAHHDAPEGQGHVAAVLSVQNDRWELRIIDDGPGVPPTALPTIAERKKKSRSGDGEGLGLAIVAAVCAREGIELRWERNPPRGLCVALSGPVSRDLQTPPTE